MPSTARAARSGRRATLRQIMRAGVGSQRARRVRSSRPARKRAGGSGRIASAGGSESTRRTALCAPISAAAAETAIASATTEKPGSKRRTGKR